MRPLRHNALSPYSGITPARNWRKGVSALDRRFLDPQTSVRFTIDRETSLASAGSCFAGRIAEHVQRFGFTYKLVEPGPAWLDADERRANGYGEYSARYGNIYSTLQLLQLAQRSLGLFDPLEQAWPSGSGLVDPFRPSIQPGGFVTKRELDADRRQHLAAVNRLWHEVDVFIFTLGLTEIWYDARDGAVFPVAPGRGKGTFDPARHFSRNLTVDENVRYLDDFLNLLWSCNPNARVILTVSPVPLAATIEEQHVIVASAYSKAVLRVAATEVVRRHPQVDYFAAYEIVVGTNNNDIYFAEDRRNVTEAAVNHVMTSFYRNYCAEELAEMTPVHRDSSSCEPESRACDEDLLLDALAMDISLSA